MSDLTDRMDTVGWLDTSDESYSYRVFQWMKEATREIERLNREVESLTRVLNSRTEHLA